MVIGAYGDDRPNALSEDDDRRSGCFARRRWLRIRVVDHGFNLAKTPKVDGSRSLLPCVPPSILDLNEFGSGGNSPIDVRVQLDLVASAVKTLVTLYVTKQRSVVATASGAGDAGSSGRIQRRILAVKRSLGECEIEVALNPRGDMLCWQKMWLCVLPVLAPALLEGLSLGLLGETGKEVGVACCDAFLREGFGYGRDQLQQ